MNEFALKYLSYYGYLPSGVSSPAIDSTTKGMLVEDAVKEFQAAAGIPVTGEIDTATEVKMMQPRCGLMDVRRATFSEARWRKTDLTYFIEKRVGGLAETDINFVIAQAWLDWMNVANFKIQPAADRANADIIISTGKGRADGFDGPSGTLAWAYLPNGTDGQLLCRFDLDETWIMSLPGGILLRNVACHEFGHLLGLEHSRVSGALMAPFYSPSIESPRQSDDISRIQGLYGKPTTPPVQPGQLPAPQVVRLGKELSAGVYGDLALGSKTLAGDYMMVPLGSAEPPPVPKP